jgi:hypothetical protein
LRRQNYKKEWAVQYRVWIGLMLMACVVASSASAEEAASAQSVASTAEAPVPQRPKPAAPPTAESPATATTAQQVPEGSTSDQRIVVVPPESVVYRLSVGAAEPTPEWTKAATQNLLASATLAISTTR